MKVEVKLAIKWKWKWSKLNKLLKYTQPIEHKLIKFKKSFKLKDFKQISLKRRQGDEV